jgi:hypothetical protein
MADFPINDDMLSRLRKAAEDARMDINAYLDSLLPADEALNDEANTSPLGTLAVMAESAHQANLRFGTDDSIAEHSREILRAQMEKRLNQRNSTQE